MTFVADIDAVGYLAGRCATTLYSAESTPLFITASAQHRWAECVAGGPCRRRGPGVLRLHPLDVDTLLAKLGTYIRASSDIDAQRSKALVGE